VTRRSLRTRCDSLAPLLVVLITLMFHGTAWPQKGQMMIRISEIEVHSEYVQEYNRILKEESGASLKLEPGVVAIFPMSQQVNPSQIRILEIYASREAYESHLLTPHFRKYKADTLKMVKSLELVEMKAIDVDAMASIFKKLNVGEMQSSAHDSTPIAKKNERH
jgi:quinol monooxygenase YgiN